MPRRLFTRYLWPSVRAANSRNRVISIPPVRLRIRPSPPSNTLSDAYDPFVINRLCAKLAFHAHGLQKAWLLDRGCVVRFSRNFYLLLVDRVKLFHYQQFSPPPPHSVFLSFQRVWIIFIIPLPIAELSRKEKFSSTTWTFASSIFASTFNNPDETTVNGSRWVNWCKRQLATVARLFLPRFSFRLWWFALTPLIVGYSVQRFAFRNSITREKRIRRYPFRVDFLLIIVLSIK